MKAERFEDIGVRRDGFRVILTTKQTEARSKTEEFPSIENAQENKSGEARMQLVRSSGFGIAGAVSGIVGIQRIVSSEGNVNEVLNGLAFVVTAVVFLNYAHKCREIMQLAKRQLEKLQTPLDRS